MPDLNVALQSSPQPTNKVTASTEAGGTIGGVIAGAVALYGGDAVRELLLNFPWIGPKLTELIVFALVGLAGYFGVKYGGRFAAYNVLDKPNVPIQAASSPALPALVAERMMEAPEVVPVISVEQTEAPRA